MLPDTGLCERVSFLRAGRPDKWALSAGFVIKGPTYQSLTLSNVHHACTQIFKGVRGLGEIEFFLSSSKVTLLRSL